jgi:hypothetical protein
MKESPVSGNDGSLRGAPLVVPVWASAEDKKQTGNNQHALLIEMNFILQR